MSRLVLKLPISRPEVVEKEAKRLQAILESRATNAKPVSVVCKELGISRFTYYRTLKRGGVQIVDASVGTGVGVGVGGVDGKENAPAGVDGQENAAADPSALHQDRAIKDVSTTTDTHDENALPEHGLTRGRRAQCTKQTMMPRRPLSVPRDK